VKNNGGSIEDNCLEGLYDPILRKIKNWGLLSDLVLFVFASAVENNSGSIPTIFDASGNERDFPQTDTAKQPALDKNSIGGRWGAGFDETDDEASNSNPLISNTDLTFFWVGNLRTKNSNPDDIFSNSNVSQGIKFGNGGSNNDLWQIATYDSGSARDVYEFGLSDTGPVYGNGTLTNSECTFRVNGADRTLNVRRGSIQKMPSSNNSFFVGSRNGSQYWDGSIESLIIFKTGLTLSQRKDIEAIRKQYYNF
jgi:hypothetical protein